MRTAGRLFFGLFLAFCLPLFAFGQDCFPNGDVNGDGNLTPADVAILLNCAIGGLIPCPPLPAGDLNCDGFRDGADFVLEYNCVYLGSAPLGPCPIVDVRPLGPPDPGDAIIVQPRIIFPPGGGAPYTSLRVWITNKDALAAVVLPLGEIQAEPPTYAVLSPDSFAITSLVPGWGFGAIQTFYAGLPPGPDPFLISGFFGSEPPNAIPKALLDINFDMVDPPCGTILFDSLPPVPPGGAYLENTIEFVKIDGSRVPVNFQMGKLAVKGDVGGNGSLTVADFVLLLNCTFLGIGICPLCGADINSNGGLDPTDVVLELNGVFLNAFSP